MKKKGCSFYMAKYSIEFKKEVVEHYKKYGAAETIRVYNISNRSVNYWNSKYESGDLMRKKNETYSAEKKLEIIEYYKEYGVFETEKEYNISNTSFYKWERQYIEYGMDGLKKDGRGRPKGLKKDINKDKDLLAENQRLRLENMYLKKLKALVEKREEQENKKK
jgi:transposase